MNCPKCGREVNGKFCPSCGAAMYGEETVVLSQANNPWAQKKAEEEAAPVPEAAPAAAPVFPQTPNPDPMPGSQNPGFAPNQVPNPNAQPPRQPVQQPGYGGQPAQSYAPAPGYIPNQGNNPGARNAGNYAPAAPIQGNSPARALVRKLATSPAFLIAVLAVTLSFLIQVYNTIPGIQVYLPVLSFGSREAQTVALTNLISLGVALLVSLSMVLALWVTFGSAAKKSELPMATGGLTLFKVYHIIVLVFLWIALAAVLSLTGFYLINRGNPQMEQAISRMLNEIQTQSGTQLPQTNLSFEVLVYVFAGVMALTLVLMILYFTKTVRSLNTAKRVIRVGVPDDRVSVYVAVMGILMVIGLALSLLTWRPKNLSAWLTLASTVLSIISSICFVTVLLRFRSGMRQLGVYKGIMQR